MKNNISIKQLREFGYLIGLGFPFFLGFFVPFLAGHNFQVWTLWIAIPTLIIGILRPFLLLYPYRGWMFIGHCLGWINSKIILGLVFIFMVQPIALIMKFFRYDPLRKNKSNKTSFKEIKTNTKINLEKIF